MVKISLNGLSLGIINLREYGYTIEQLESCGYRVELIA